MAEKSFSNKYIGKIDWLLVAISLLLAIFGILIIYSLEANSGGPFTFFYKQLIFLVVGLIVWGISLTINYKHLKSYSKFIYIIGLLLLVAVIFFGQEIRGVRGWFIIGPVSLQPVEFLKLFVVIFFAKYFTDYGNLFYQNKELFKAIFLILPFIVLLILQPDLGSAFIVAMIWLVMLLFTKIKFKQIIALLLVVLVMAVSSWSFLADYQQDRLKIFLNPSSDPQGAGYNIQQAITAVGSGQWLGKGLGQGSQSQLHFLPENRTDFIFAVIAEELGFVGATILIILYLVLLLRLVKIAKSTNNLFGFYLVLGIIIFTSTQTFMNLAMNLSLFPVTGIPLPLVSQGGSSLWSILLALGLAQSVKVHD